MRILKLKITAVLVAIVAVTMASTPQSLQRGIELYNDGRWIDARLTLLEAKNNIIDSNSADLEGLDFYLAMCAVELDDLEAEEYLLDFMKRYPASAYLNRVRFSMAMLHCSYGYYHEAGELFKQVNYTTLTPEQREGYDMRVGYILFLDKKYQAAQEYFVKIDKDSDIYQHALYYISYIDYLQEDMESARRGFTQLQYSDAYAPVAPYYLLQIEFNSGNYAQVLRDGEALYAKSIVDRQRELARSMAEAAFRLERYDDAIEYINKYRSIGGDMRREENYILGFSLYREVRYDEALEYLRAACGADDALTQNASYHLADCYLREDDKGLASISFAMAVNEKYNAEIAEDALFNYAKLQYELGDDRFNETINTLVKYINRYPSSGHRYDEAKELLITAYYNSQNYDIAYLSIKELENPDADFRLALQRITLNRGLESYNRRDYQSAVYQLNESLAVNISPRYSSVARFYLGEISFAAGDYEAALNNYNSYFVIAPASDENYSLALYNIAYTKSMLDNEGEALGYYQRFVESTTEDTFYRADAYNRLGDIFYSKRQFPEAQSNYQKATLSKYNPHYYALYQSAIIDGIVGNYTAKVTRLSGIVSLGEGDYVETSMYELGRSYIAASDYRSGVATHERFIEKYPSSDKYAQALSDLGLAYLNLGEKSISLSYYDKAIKVAPQSAVAKDALQGVRDIYVNEGNVNEYFDYVVSVGHSGDINSMTRDSLTFASAQRLYISSEGKSDAVISSLTNYINSYPQGYYTVDALFFLSDSYIKQNRNTDAIATLIQLTKKATNQYTERVYDRLSLLLFNEKLYGQSADAYLKLYKMSSKAEVMSKAIVGYVNATIMNGDDKSTLAMAQYLLKQKNIEPQLMVKVKHAKAMILNKGSDTASALALFKDLSSDPSTAEGAESLYMVIKSEFDNGSIEKAEQMIFDFSASNTPQSYFLARAFILLGDIYVSRGDTFQARATYQSILDGYAVDNDGVIEQARARIANLE
ncbi:MAG: tetratricopeptide repeat protein [Rikenellaceae bacterium]